MMPRCVHCGNREWTWAAMIDHLRLMHPDVDAEPERWPDGRPVVVDLTLTPDDFEECK